MKTEYAVFYQNREGWNLVESFATRQEAARKAMAWSTSHNSRICSVNHETGDVQILSTFGFRPA